MAWRLLVRKQQGSATDLPVSQYRSLSRTILSSHPRSVDISYCNDGVTEGGLIGKSPAECGRTLDKVWQIFTPPTQLPAQAEAKAKVC